MPRSRLTNVVVASAAGGAFLVGLLRQGALSAVILLAVAAFLIVLSRAAWPTVPARGRRLRILVIGVVVAIALAKLAG